MATYAELHAIFNEETLMRKIEVAIIEAARIVAAGEDSGAPFDQTAGAHDNRIRWAGRAVTNTGQTARDMMKLVLAQNKGATTDQILNATDTAVQTNVNAMVDVLAKALSLS